MTFSINTNNAAMAALESLSMTQQALQETQSEVSTGLRVGSAADNPAIYAIAQQMNGNIAGLSAVSDSLTFGAQVVNTASAASQNIISTLTSLQNQVTLAGQTGINTATMQSAVANALNQINIYARNSTFNGVNLLTTSADAGSTVTSNTLSVVDSLQGGALAVANQAVKANGTSVNSLTDALGLTTGMTGGEKVIASGTAGTGQVTQSILTSGASGVNIGFSSSLVAGSFANGKNVVITNGDGSTTTFEFDASGTAATATNTATNKVVVVQVATGSETTNQMIGNLVNAMNANGYNAVVQSDGSVNVTGQGLTASASTVTGINAGTSLTAGSAVITTLQGAISRMTSITSNLGYASQQITGMQNFTTSLKNALTSGVGALTDADLSAESARLTSLQTKQQLAIQSLSIANSQSQSILSLFR